MIVNNQSKTFEKKISQAINLIAGAVGLPADNSLFKRYLICPDSIDASNNHRHLNFPPDIKTETLQIKETYLTPPEGSNATSICVRKREKNGLSNFHYEKRFVFDGERTQELRRISAREYSQLVDNH